MAGRQIADQWLGTFRTIMPMPKCWEIVLYRDKLRLYRMIVDSSITSHPDNFRPVVDAAHPRKRHTSMEKEQEGT